MEEIRLENFDPLLDSVKEIRNEIVSDKEKAKKKEKRDQITQVITFFIAVFSFLLGIYSIYDNNISDERNFNFQRKTQAYNFWLSYLRLASQHPELANGLQKIDGVPVSDLACRHVTGIKYPDSTQSKFVEYAWFVANALGTAEVLSDFTKRDDAWIATVDTIISNHISYVRSTCFEKKHYGYNIKYEIQKIIDLRKE